MLSLLLKKINEDNFISCKMFTENDIDELLDLRDEPEFDSEWMRVFNKLEGISCSDADMQVINDIRKEAFLKAYNASNSGEIASCVSDDFDLFARAYALSINDCWLNSVMLHYINNIYPCGKIKQSEINIEEVFQKLSE